MREIIKKGNNSPEEEPPSKKKKLNASSASGYNLIGTTDSLREDCTNLGPSLNDSSPRQLELSCYQTSNNMVVKQEGAGLEIKPDPEGTLTTSPLVMNGEDSLKNNIFSKQNYDSKIKLDLVNGNIPETDVKPTVSDIGMTPSITCTNPCISPAEIESMLHFILYDCPTGPEGPSLKGCSAGAATSDAQYMQQQSQIFVFTTQLANKAAEELAAGTVPNIIQFHCNQPATRKILEKNPLKLNQFSKTNPSQIINNMTMKVPKSGNMKSQTGPSHINEMGQMTNMPSCVTGPQENQTQSMMINQMGQTGGHMMGLGSMVPMGMNGPRDVMLHTSGMPGPMSAPMNNNRMQGSTVPEVILTQEQRKHREEQFSRIYELSNYFDHRGLWPSQTEMRGSQTQQEGQSNVPNCQSNNGMQQGPQINNNSVLSQTPSADHSDISSNSLQHIGPQSNQCGVPTPNPCAMQVSCAGPNTTSCGLQIPESCSNPILPSVGPNPGGPPRACSNPPINGNCGLPMTGNFAGIASSVPLQTNVGSGPISCAQTSTISGTTNCQTNTSTGMGPSQTQSSSCSQNNINISQSPVSGMGPSPGLGHSPTIGPTPGMMGPGMGMGTGMMGPFCPMSSQQNMMMGQGPMGNPMMGPTQPGMMANGMGPGMPPMRIMAQQNPMMMGGPNSAVAQMDWNRTLAEQMELKRKKCQMSHDGPMGPGPHMGNPLMSGHMMSGHMHSNMGIMPMNMRHMGSVPVNRMQGPPPPYHGPSPRSMGNGNLHSPGSPSMCPITSPRMPNNCPQNSMRLSGPVPGIDSPRPSCSNTPTPVSNGAVTSPSISIKDQATPQSVSNEMPLGRQIQNFSQQKQQTQMGLSCVQQMSHMSSHLVPNQPPEPSLMPVPSPQQIQYLTSFDGQELTIQKQPNTSLRDTNILSPLESVLDGSSENLTSLGNKASGPTTPQAGPSTPHTPLTEAGRYNNGPQTPDRFPVPSPGMAPPSTPHTPQQNGPVLESKPQTARFGGHSSQSQSQSNSGGPKTPSLDSRFPVPSPKTPGICGGSNNPIDTSTRFHGASPHLTGNINDLSTMAKFPSVPSNTTSCQKMSSGFSPGKISALEIGAEFNTQSTGNLPLDPIPSGMTNSITGKALDPISSMAQMSQQLGASGQPGSPPIPSASTPTLPTGAMPIVGSGPAGSTNMIDNQVTMMGIPPVSSSPAMMSGPVPSPVTGGITVSSPSNMSIMPGNSGMISNNPIVMHGSPGMMPINPAMMHSGNMRMVIPGTRQPGPNVGVNGPFNGNNVQVKANAPSTINYLPVRPQNNVAGPRVPTTIEFISRFNTPAGLEKPVSPMYSNNGTPNAMCASGPMPNMTMNVPCNAMGNPMCPTGQMTVPGGIGSMPVQIPGPNGPVGNTMIPMSVPSGAFTMNGPTGHVPGPNGPMTMGPNGPMPAMTGHMGPNGHMMGPNGPMMGPNGPIAMNPAMMSNGPIGPNGQIMTQRGMQHMMRGGPNSAAMMGAMGNEMYAMGGPPGGMPGAPMGPTPPAGHPNQNQMMQGSAPMFASKGSPGMGMGSPMGSAPDTAQPLPPSMGQSGNYKNSHFMVPTTADPNYAAQFHNFQQQLYATNTRVGPPMGPMGVSMGPGGPHGPVVPGMPGPPHMVHQFPFNPK